MLVRRSQEVESAAQLLYMAEADDPSTPWAELEPWIRAAWLSEARWNAQIRLQRERRDMTILCIPLIGVHVLTVVYAKGHYTWKGVYNVVKAYGWRRFLTDPGPLCDRQQATAEGVYS